MAERYPVTPATVEDLRTLLGAIRRSHRVNEERLVDVLYFRHCIEPALPYRAIALRWERTTERARVAHALARKWLHHPANQECMREMFPCWRGTILWQAAGLDKEH